ncbi:MAG: glycosyltransferase family 2 protein [Candidatus Hermodarchaeota archaeon]
MVIINVKEPMVTIFTPNYNKSQFICETIESILNQKYSNFEYIIIDDCSTDNSWEIIQNYAKVDERIKIYRNTKNLGIVKTRNKGFKKRSSKSKYFAIIDSDDISLPERLKIQVDFLEHNPDYGIVGSDILIIDAKSKIIGFRKYPSKDTEIRKLITRFNPFAQSSIIIRTEIIDQIGFYDEAWSVCQDYDYWLRVGIKWKLANLDKALIKYRININQIKSTQLKETIRNTYFIQKKAINLYNYKDRIINKLIRIIIRFSVLYPKFLYFLYNLSIKINIKNFKLI